MSDHPPADFMFAPRTFVRVYRVPERSDLTRGYCFGGGVQIPFLNVDWFETIISEGREALTGFIRAKRYYDPKARFLVLGDHPDFVYVIEPPDAQSP